MPARRVTPIHLVDDIDDSRRNYESLGLVPKPTDDAGCIGMLAQTGGLILVDRPYVERTLPARAVRLLEAAPGLYVWVDSLDTLRDALPGPLLGECLVTPNLREWAVDACGGLIVFAETRAH